MAADSAASARAQRRTTAMAHLACAVLVFGAWELYARAVLREEVLLPPPSAAFRGLVEITFGGPLIPALLGSLQLLLVGFGLAAAVGFVLGVVIGRYRKVDQTISPFVNALYATPIIALVPLVLVWFGFGFAGRVVVVFLASFFPLLINVAAGVRDAPGELIEVARSFGVSRETELLRRVVLPAATPFIIAGLRLAIGRGIVGMAVAEVYLRLGGIGALITEYGSAFRTDLLIAAIVPLPLLALALTWLLAIAERRFSYWRTV